MNGYERVFATIARDVEVLDDNSFRHHELGILRPTHEVNVDPVRPVLSHLWRFLYLQYYAGDLAAARILLEGAELVMSVPDWEDAEFVARVAAAHHGRGYFSGGWQVVAIDREQVRVERQGLTLTTRRDEVRGETAVTVGSDVEVRFPPYLRYAQPRWYVLVSDSGPFLPDGGPVVRSYFTVSGPDVVPDLIEALSGRLNCVGAVFHLKVLNHPSAYGRRDPVVLYLHRGAWDRHRHLLAEIHDAFAARLRFDGPCFAFQIGRGWRIADEPEHPGSAMSFGQHRCLLVAEALVDAYRQGVTNADGRFAAIVDRYRAEGLDVRRPYANRRATTEEGVA